MSTRATICEIISDGKLLLQHKKLGKFGAGKWNGPGGKIEPGESPREAVIREVQEETGLVIYDVKYRGMLDFYFGKKPKPDWTCYVFSTESYKGTPRNLGEGELKWFDFVDIPYKEMWPDDEYWLPLILKGKNFNGYFIYGETGERLIEHHIDLLHKL